MRFRVSGKVMRLRLLQFSKAQEPISVTGSRKVISSKPMQLRKAPFPMDFSAFGIRTDFRLLQPENA